METLKGVVVEEEEEDVPLPLPLSVVRPPTTVMTPPVLFALEEFPLSSVVNVERVEAAAVVFSDGEPPSVVAPGGVVVTRSLPDVVPVPSVVLFPWRPVPPGSVVFPRGESVVLPREESVALPSESVVLPSEESVVLPCEKVVANGDTEVICGCVVGD